MKQIKMSKMMTIVVKSYREIDAPKYRSILETLHSNSITSYNLSRLNFGQSVIEGDSQLIEQLFLP